MAETATTKLSEKLRVTEFNGDELFPVVADGKTLAGTPQVLAEYVAPIAAELAPVTEEAKASAAAAEDAKIGAQQAQQSAGDNADAADAARILAQQAEQASSLNAVQAVAAAQASSQASTAAQAARDAALIQAGVFADEPTGRAAVADGQAFKVQGDGAIIAAYEYRRMSAASSVLIGTYPASGSVSALSSLAGRLSNVFASAQYDYYVDPILGSDANDGKSRLRAWAGFANFASIAGPINGLRIGIVCGSKIYDQLVMTGTHIVVGAYGVGDLPIVDATAPVSGGWALASGKTYTYQATIALPNNVKAMGNVFVDDVPMKQVTTQASVETTPGSYYVSSWTGASATLYLHTSTGVSPAADGHAYTYSRRLYCISLTGTDCEVHGVIQRGQAHQDGSMSLYGNRGYASYVQAVDGGRHCAYIQPNSLIEDSVFIGGRDDIEAPGYANTLVVNAPAIVGTWYRTRRCYFGAKNGQLVTGPDNHGAVPTDLFASIVHELPIFDALQSCATMSAVYGLIDRPSFWNSCLSGSILNAGSTTTCQYGSGLLNQICASAGAATFVSKGNAITVSLLANGFYQSTDTSGNGNLTVDSDRITVKAANFPSNVRLLNYASGHITVKNSVFGPAVCFPATNVFVAGSGGPATYSADSDGNVYPIGADFVFNGVTYPTLAAWQAAGHEPNSTTAVPTTLFADNFQRADAFLDGNNGWTRIGGAANMAGIRSNALAILGSTQTLYASPAQLSKGPHFARCTIAAVPATAGSFLVICAVDSNNWIGVRWSASQFQIYTCVAGTLSQIGTSSAVGPAVGQDVILGVRGNYVYLYVNNQKLTAVTGSSVAGLVNNVLTGIVCRAIQNPLMNSFSTGPA
ncbi:MULTISPECIES: hypothetical protein [unclassified Burkholderia]|uniref:hypothetical protein n=1 Tax=unclassified Burkholderia TaxID=2613784 RepID=UPI002AB1EAF9|nr:MULTISPECIES: hypothetical protein [unclassified Burkholderia]